MTESTTKVAARYLRPGDVVGSGETVVYTSAGAKTPRGKIGVLLQNVDGKRRSALWGASTTINVRRIAS
jgi:hypothetical protein